MPGFLSFSKKGGHEYGFICFSTWLPKNEVSQGKVHKKFVTLGRVLDKTELIFRNRKQGIIQVDPDTLEIKSPPPEYVPPLTPRKKRTTKKGTIEMSLQANGHVPLSLDFGDCFFLDNLVLGGWREIMLGFCTLKLIFLANVFLSFWQSSEQKKITAYSSHTTCQHAKSMEPTLIR